MNKKYIIRCTNDHSLYWNNKTGFGSKRSAKRYTQTQKDWIDCFDRMCIEGEWVEL